MFVAARRRKVRGFPSGFRSRCQSHPPSPFGRGGGSRQCISLCWRRCSRAVRRTRRSKSSCSKAPLEESASQQQDALPTNTAAPGCRAASHRPARQRQRRRIGNRNPFANDRQVFSSKAITTPSQTSHCESCSAAGNVLDVNRGERPGQSPITEQKRSDVAQRLCIRWAMSLS